MLIILRQLFLKSNNQVRDSYTWNTLQSLLISLQSAILLTVISRTNGLDDSGIFSIAYAVASLLYYLSEYGVRKFQVTDTNEQASFSDYYTHRIITCTISVFISISYVLVFLLNGKYDSYKARIIILVCLEKVIEGYCDVFFARFQQKGRLDAAAKASAYRLSLSLLFCITILFITHNMLIAMCVWVIATILTTMTSFLILAPEFGTAKIRFKKDKFLLITKECLPLFLGNSLLLYIGNAPKFAIDACLSNSDQACYNFIFMPVFVIGLLANFIFNPILKELAVEWNSENHIKFFGLVKRQTLVITFITLLAVVVALTIGCPVLGWIFHVNLDNYPLHLALLMLGGGMLAFANFLTVTVTVLRGQKLLIIAYLIAAFAAGLFSKPVVSHFGLYGACILYVMLMTIVTISSLILFVMYVRKSENDK